MLSLIRACGLKAMFDESASLGARSVGSGAEALAEVGRRSETRSESLKAGSSWEDFFHEARRRPGDAVLTLLRDLNCNGAGASISGFDSPAFSEAFGIVDSATVHRASIPHAE